MGRLNKQNARFNVTPRANVPFLVITSFRFPEKYGMDQVINILSVYIGDTEMVIMD
jgi:hypothetical protein